MGLFGITKEVGALMANINNKARYFVVWAGHSLIEFIWKIIQLDTPKTKE